MTLFKLVFATVFCFSAFPLNVQAQEFSKTRADSLIALLNAPQSDDQKLQTLFNITRVFWRYIPDSAIVYAQKQRDLAERVNNKIEIQRAVNTIGYMLEIKGSYAESWKYRKLDEKLSIELADSTALAFAYYGLGNLSTYIGNYPEGLDYHLRALRIRERGTDKYQLGWSYTNIGYVYSLQGLSEQAIEFRKKALECFSTPGILNVRARDNVMRFLAEDYVNQKEFEKALEMYTELLHIKQKRGDPPSQIAYTEEEIGWVLYSMGRSKEAIQHYERALALMRSSDVRREPLTLNRMAKAYLLDKNYANSRETATKALNIGIRQQRPDVVSESKWILAEEAQVNGRLTEAIGYLKSYWAIRDSIFSSENQMKVAARETAYEVEKKQREIERLEQQNQVQNLVIKSQKLERNLLLIVAIGIAIIALGFAWLVRLRQHKNSALERAVTALNASQEMIAQRNGDLEKLNKEKDYFFSIIGHDLRNPFSAVLGLSNELKENAGDFSKKEIEEIAGRMHHNAAEVLDLLGNLLDWAKLELGSDPVRKEPVKMDVLIEKILSLYAVDIQSKKLNIQVQSEKNVVVQTDANIVSVVVRNLFSNAIKFSHPESQITLSTKYSNSELSIIVADQGVGMNAETLGTLFKIGESRSKLGTNQESGTGLGLILCQRYTEKIGGILHVESTPGKGTNFKLSIPISDGIT